jgi:hypothetical protein
MNQTTNVRVMEKWIKKRKGFPAIVKGTPNLLRVKFDTLENDLEEITWAKFFKTFKDNKLLFLYEDDDTSRFCKFIYKKNNTIDSN